jgi:plasmid stability protein
MANLTVVIESDTLKRARIRALEEGTSVNAVVRDYLADYAGTKAQNEKAIKDLLRLSKRTKTKRGNRRWTREDLHKR